MICDECETVAHCLKNGCVPKTNVQQEPVAGKGKELSEQLKLCARNVAFVAAGRVDMSSAAIQEMFTLIDHVCVGIDSPQPAQQRHLSELEKDAANLLFALHDAWPYVHGNCTIESKKKAIQALMVKHGDFADLLPQPAQQEPVAFLVDGDLYYPEEIDWETLQEQGHTVAPLYTRPPTLSLAQHQRSLKPLTDEAIEQIWRRVQANDFHDCVQPFARAIEAKLKEKNSD